MQKQRYRNRETGSFVFPCPSELQERQKLVLPGRAAPTGTLRAGGAGGKGRYSGGEQLKPGWAGGAGGQRCPGHARRAHPRHDGSRRWFPRKRLPELGLQTATGGFQQRRRPLKMLHTHLQCCTVPRLATQQQGNSPQGNPYPEEFRILSHKGTHQPQARWSCCGTEPQSQI